MRSISSLALTSLVTSLIFTTNAYAQDSTFDPAGSWAFNFGLEQVSFNKEQAASPSAQIDDSAIGLIFEGEYFFSSHYSATVGMEYLAYDDNGSFTQNTTDGYKSSDASGIPIYGELGYKRFFGENERAYVTARAGMSIMVSSERSISYCSDCAEQDIEIDGGFYGMAGLGVRLGHNWALGAHYKSYLTGDIENAVGVSVSYGYW